MTAQIKNTMIFEGKEFCVLAVEREWPFDPRQHGFEPHSTSTACWRGYHTGYTVRDGELLLTRLTIGLAGSKGRYKPPVWRGLHPRPSTCAATSSDWEYAGVDVPVPYTGGLVLGRDGVREFIDPMLLIGPHCFEEVHELLFERGVLTGATDRSEAMEGARRRIRAVQPRPQWPEALDLEPFLRDAFFRSYKGRGGW